MFLYLTRKSNLDEKGREVNIVPAAIMDENTDPIHLACVGNSNHQLSLEVWSITNDLI